MFGEVKLGKADYTVVWETQLLMSTLKYPGKGLLKPKAVSWFSKKTIILLEFVLLEFCAHD